MPGPFEIGAGGPDSEPGPQDAVHPPLDTMFIRVSRLDRDELKHAVNSLLDGAAGNGERGWKLYAAPDSPVYCVTCGIVLQLFSWRKELSLVVELNSAPANRIAAAHGARRIVAIYSGLGASAVSVGDPVAAGQVLGRIGAAGPESLPHLRFELRTHVRGGKRLDPGELLGKPQAGMGASCG